MDHSVSGVNAPSTNGSLIRLDKVFKNLGGKQILKGVSLDIHEGETRVIIGRSGEGKSVLIKHICRLMQPDQGEVWVDGDEISKTPERELTGLRRKVGLLFQYAALFDSLDVLHNVGFTLYEQNVDEDEIIERVRKTLKQVQLGDILYKMPSELSGGMKKRVGLARSIIQNPKILLYDEPTTGLDPVTSEAINDLIIHLAESLNLTSLVITHDMKSAFKIASKISMVFEGEIIYTGTPDEITDCDNAIIRQFINGETEGPLSNL